MAGESIDFAVVLAVLEARRAKLDALIEKYREALMDGTIGQAGDLGTSGVPVGAAAFKGGGLGGAPIELPTGAFLGKSIPVGIKIYLEAARRKQTLKEIAAALREGGIESTSDNFESVVKSALGNLRQRGEVLRFKDGWALAEFYPAHLRQGLTAAKNGKAKNGGKKPASKAKAAKRPAKKAAKPTAPDADASAPDQATAAPGLAARIEAFLRENGRAVAVAEINAAFPERGVPLALGRLVLHKKAIKAPDGTYSAIAA